MDFKRLDTVKSCLLAFALAVAIPAGEAASPAAAAAQSTAPSGGQTGPANGGTPAGDGSASSGSAPTSSSTGGSDGLVVPSGLLLHQVASLSGTLAGSDANTPLAIERLDPARGTWTAIASTTTAAGGAFVAHWRADHIGRFTLRAVRSGAGTADAGAQSQLPTAQLTVYRPTTASWFGPGFYGKRTACGQTMSPTLLGVAHRSIPCGTLVDVIYAGRAITVPVVDRGPYRHGVSWDLTAATAQALGLTETARIGALALRGVTAPSLATGDPAASPATGVSATSGSTGAGATSAPAG